MVDSVSSLRDRAGARLHVLLPISFHMKAFVFCLQEHYVLLFAGMQSDSAFGGSVGAKYRATRTVGLIGMIKFLRSKGSNCNTFTRPSPNMDLLLGSYDTSWLIGILMRRTKA